jgi:hypothetical protein
MAIACDRVREIASGFVLGALEPAEMTAVREHLDRCRKPHPEILELGGVLPYLAVSLQPVEPPRHLRVAVLAVAEADLRARCREATAATPEPVPAVAAAAPASGGRVISLASVRRIRSRRSLVWLTRAAAVAIVGLLGGYAMVIRGVLGRPQPSSYYYPQSADRSTNLEPQGDGKANGIAVLRPTGNIVAYMHGLTPTRGDEVYTVWLRADDADPVAVASFTVDGLGEAIAQINQAPRAAELNIGVTLEPKSGATVPTGPVVLSGTISL